jgi:hypothetical protein
MDWIILFVGIIIGAFIGVFVTILWIRSLVRDPAKMMGMAGALGMNDQKVQDLLATFGMGAKPGEPVDIEKAAEKVKEIMGGPENERTGKEDAAKN